MAHLKTVFIAAGAAFVLSFFTALISRVGFPLAFLRGFIFALIFGGGAFGICFLFDKVLDVEASVPDTAEETSKPVMGSKVDLTLQEEDLTDEEDSPQFSVERETHFLNKDDLSSTGGTSATKNGDLISDEIERVKNKHAGVTQTSSSSGAPDAFKPVNLGDSPKFKSVESEEKLDVLPEVEGASGKPDSGTGNASVPPASPKPAPEAASSPVVSDDETLDELPDLGELGGEDGASEADDDIIEDSEFASAGSNRESSSVSFPDGKVADSKDSGLMAEAIRTILKNEE